MEPSHFGIKIKTLDNSLHELDISPEMTVKNLKTLIEDKMKVPVPKQRLIFHGKLLLDTEKLSKYKIEDGHVLHLVANPLESLSPNLSHSQSTSIPNPQTTPPLRNSNSGNELDILTGIIRTINQTSLNRRNLRRRLMQQRSNGFNVEPNESLGVIKQSFQSLNMVMDCATKFPEIASIKNLNKNTFINPFNFASRKLQLGQWIDVKDTIDQWLEAQVIRVQNSQVYVHYNGWGSRWDEWLDMNSPRIALFRTYTVQSSHSLYLSPNPINQADGELNELVEPKLETQDVLFDLSSMLNKITSSVIDLAKLMNYKKIKEKEAANQANEEEYKVSPNEDIIPAEVKISVLNSQLAPIFDRVGRLMIDLAPHLALQGADIQTIFVPVNNNSNIENNFPPAGSQEENLQKTHVFQVPVMLTPGEILSINNAGDRNNTDGDFPRNTIIIGSRGLGENLNENNRNGEEERAFQREEHHVENEPPSGLSEQNKNVGQNINNENDELKEKNEVNGNENENPGSNPTDKKTEEHHHEKNILEDHQEINLENQVKNVIIGNEVEGVPKHYETGNEGEGNQDNHEPEGSILDKKDDEEKTQNFEPNQIGDNPSSGESEGKNLQNEPEFN